jgi:hypothetical protein
MSTRFYPFLSGSEYTASFAITSSQATSASFWDYSITSSNSVAGVSGSIGLRGSPDICFITTDQYFRMLFTSSLQEACAFPDRDLQALGGNY